jgi:hypothetical protein
MTRTGWTNFVIVNLTATEFFATIRPTWQWNNDDGSYEPLQRIRWRRQQ